MTSAEAKLTPNEWHLFTDINLRSRRKGPRISSGKIVTVIEKSAYDKALDLIEDLNEIMGTALLGHHDLIARTKDLLKESGRIK